ncbi:pyrroline-5-carboxylate reductase [Anaerotalea alkaliphila]|uniref:Pyrroline-5-carboxylate reductase n=1 Tax=Anaerotalea alkaliphila TaxID=2662126 RepID=A0A7X5KLU6_9FIRM|nr:pyrroline-5-carboxylate reductase [Anaerotalea alkaliphila]NDL66284.1 pyrroline-5-carboxylate reductase [Anaerotalea alkaliphila]
MKTIGFIGAGNMGAAMMQGAKKVFGDGILFTDISRNRMEELQDQLGLPFVLSNQECVDQASYVVLAIKPQYYGEALEGIRPRKGQVFISIAPGISISKVKALLGGDVRVVRAMPNTPALLGEGMSAISFSEDPYQEEERDTVRRLFDSFGKTLTVPESQMDMVVPLSGSSPAYVYMLIEAMADAGVLTGMPRKDAYMLAAQSVVGAARMVLETGRHPGALKDDVCSPGGTTIEAVKVLEAKGFRSAIIEAMEACWKKAKSFQSQD